MNGALAILFSSIFIWKATKGLPFTNDKQALSSDSVRFLVLADWGGSPYPPFTTGVQVRVAHQMALKAEKEKVSFVLALGDNFYMNGVVGFYDERFKKTFEEVYNQESLNIPWYIIAGNHDHYGTVESQILYSTISNRWNFPDFYYKESKTLPGGKVLDILFLDTYILCGPTYNTPFGHRIRAPLYYSWAESQWEWIQSNLKESKADYLLVVGHYPVYSAGSNGPTKLLYERLEPLLYKYRVTAYLSGHDHNLQHIQMKSNGAKMDYFIIGSGSNVDWYLDSKIVPDNSLKFSFAYRKDVGGFAFLEASDLSLRIVFIDSEGNEKYEYNMLPRTLQNDDQET